MNKLDYVIIIIVLILIFVISFMISYTYIKDKHYKEMYLKFTETEFVIQDKYVKQNWYGKYKYYIVLNEDDRLNTYEVDFKTYMLIN